MEILSLLRLNLWRLAALIAVSAICAAIAAFSIAGRPVSYTADATVFVARALPSTASAFEITPFAADFEASTQLMSIRTVVAERLELPIDDVVVTTERPEGSTVTVLATHADGPTAERIAASMASASLEFLARDRVERSDSLLANRQATADEAKAALRNFEEQNGYTDVVREYDTRVVQMLELEGRAEDQSAEYTLAERRQLSELARDIRDELPALANSRDQFLDLSQTASESKFALDSVVNERRNAEAGLISATTTNITATESEPVSKVPLIVQAAVAATMVVFALGIALFFLVDLIRDRRPAADTASTDDLVSDADGTAADNKAAAEARVATTSEQLASYDVANESPADDEQHKDDDESADREVAELETVPSTKLKPVRDVSSSNGSGSTNVSRNGTKPSSNGSATNGNRPKSIARAENKAKDQSPANAPSSSKDDAVASAVVESDTSTPAASSQPSTGGRVIAMNSTSSSMRNAAKRSKAPSMPSDENDGEMRTRPSAGLGRAARDRTAATEQVKAAVGDGATPPIGSGTPTEARRRTKISKGRQR